jgi:uroporphyrinogen decarboxylase
MQGQKPVASNAGFWPPIRKKTMSHHLSKRERVDAALKGEAVDRVPVSAWQHFLPAERSPDTLAAASLKHFHDFDWDWLKVNPRATYYAEAWGSVYDYDNYTGVLPQLVHSPLQSPANLDEIAEISGTESVFGEQIQLISYIKAGINGRDPKNAPHFLLTVFSPLSVLYFLVAKPNPNAVDLLPEAQYAELRHYLRENPKGAHAALQNIAASLGKYAAAAVDAGASGLFFAIVRLAREGVLSPSEFEEFGKPYDLQVLKAVEGAPFNLLHICGPKAYFDIAAQYPVHAINWASIGQNNPSLGQAAGSLQKALVGGVDETDTLQRGTPDQVIQQAVASIQATGGRRHLLTPGCATSIDVPAENLHALRRAADVAGSGS